MLVSDASSGRTTRSNWLHLNGKPLPAADSKSALVNVRISLYVSSMFEIVPRSKVAPMSEIASMFELALRSN